MFMRCYTLTMQRIREPASVIEASVFPNNCFVADYTSCFLLTKVRYIKHLCCFTFITVKLSKKISEDIITRPCVILFSSIIMISIKFSAI